MPSRPYLDPGRRILCQYLMRANEHAIRMSHCTRLCLTALTMLHDHQNVKRLTSIVPRVRQRLFSIFRLRRPSALAEESGAALLRSHVALQASCSLRFGETHASAAAATEERGDRLKRQQHREYCEVCRRDTKRKQGANITLLRRSQMSSTAVTSYEIVRS